jgi:hypothetical protein
MITDKEWQKYLKEEYNQVIFCLPKKEDIEKFLTWRNKQKKRKIRKGYRAKQASHPLKKIGQRNQHKDAERVE